MPPKKTAYKRSVRAIDGFKGSLVMATAQNVRVLGCLKWLIRSARRITVVNFSHCKPILIPIPSRRPSIKARGFDPLALISRHLSRAGYPIAHWLIDQRAAGRTKTLGTADRKNASHDAFRVRPIPDHYVRNPIPAIVIDDVATSGTTLTAAVSQLLLSGVHVTGCAAIAGTRKL